MSDRRILRHMVFACALLLYAVPAFHRNMAWHTSVSFWFDAAKKTPEKARTRNNYGYALINAKNYDSAIKELKEAVRIDRTYEEPHYNLCLAYAMKGDYGRALEECSEVVRIDEFLKKGHMGVKPRYEARARNNLGNIYNMMGLYEKAVAEYREALKIKPDAYNFRFNLADAYQRLGMYGEALKEYEEISRQNPSDEEARRNAEMLMKRR